MDAAECLSCLSGKPVDLIGFGYIGGHRENLGASRSQRTLGPSQRLDFHIREDNFHPFRGESFGESQADTACGSGHDRDPTFQGFHCTASSAGCLLLIEI
jgi:hypothetical protein